MRLPLKFALALLPGVVLVLGAHTMLRLRREATFFEMDMAHDAAMLSRVLAESIVQIWPDGGPTRVDSLIRRLNQQSVLVQLRWVDGRHPGMAQLIRELPAQRRDELVGQGFT